MNIKLKCFFVGSLICLAVAGFHRSYGMIKNEELIKPIGLSTDHVLRDESSSTINQILSDVEIFHYAKIWKTKEQLRQDDSFWKKKALKFEMSEIEKQKVIKGFFTWKQMVFGKFYWFQYSKWTDSLDSKELKEPLREEGLKFLTSAVKNGNEDAIRELLDLYYYNHWLLELKNDPEVFKIAEDHANKGSEVAIVHILNAYHFGRYELGEDNPAGIERAKKYADKGNEVAVYYLLNAHLKGWYKVKRDLQECIEVAKVYIKKGSRIAIDFLQNNSLD